MTTQEGKTALITGSYGGLGTQFVNIHASRGGDLILVGRNAKKLGYSKRTLQRKLSSENTTFQKQLNSTREVLALNYLQNTDMTTSDIAYLLGYQEFNSFLRAFSIWKGMSISEYREKIINIWIFPEFRLKISKYGVDS